MSILAQARAVLDALEFSQGEILSIEVAEAGDGRLPRRSEMSALQEMTPVLQGEQPLEARVMLQIRY